MFRPHPDRAVRWSRRSRWGAPGLARSARPHPRSRARQRLEGRRLHVGRGVGDDHDRRPVRGMGPQRVQRPIEIRRVLRRDDDDRGQPDRRVVGTRRHVCAGAVSDTAALIHIRRDRRGECEVRAAVDDLPAGRLDLGAQPVGLSPVVRGARLGALMRGGQDGFGDVGTRHGMVMLRPLVWTRRRPGRAGLTRIVDVSGGRAPGRAGAGVRSPTPPRRVPGYPEPARRAAVPRLARGRGPGRRCTGSAGHRPGP